MATVKLDMLWSPRLADKYLTFGTDLRLFAFDTNMLAKRTNRIEGEHASQLTSINSEFQYLKHVSWSPREDYETLLAVGQQNGKVVLTSFNPKQDTCGLLAKEFAPRHPRQLHCLAWSPTEKNLLAAGYEKSRNECSMLVWDVQKPAYHAEPDRRSLSNSYDSSYNHPRPVAEFGLNEATNSFHWLMKEPRTIVAGLNNKHLKICDIRDGSRQPTSTSTKAVFGVCADLFHANWVASYFENQTMIWDIRNFEKPMITITDAQPIVKIAWCLTRANLLALVAKDSSLIKLYDIQQTGSSSDEPEPTIVERQLPGGQTLQSFSWHPSLENCIMTVGSAGQLHSHVVCERITLNWSPTSKLVWSHGKRILQYIDQTDELYSTLDDISVKMRERAIAGYGLEMQQLWKNGEIVKDDVVLKNLWRWLDLVKSLRDESKLRAGVSTSKTFSQIGIHSIIRSDSNLSNGGSTSRSDLVMQTWEGMLNKPPTKTYFSCNRERALQLCRWNCDRDEVSLDGLEESGYYQRAATMAVFNCKILKAMKILRNGAVKIGDPSLHTVAMALSGYTVDKSSLWRDICDKLRSELLNPYLRAMFAFLTCDNDSFDNVLNETDVAVQDRVAFACVFLPDNKLADFLDGLMKNMIENGSLDGMLLTGLSKDGIDLLQRYVDMTGDIQTASLIVIQSLPCEAESETRALQWIESYRQVLDQWRLWQQRAQFDVNWHKPDTNWRATQQVFISCNFCGKSISSLMHAMGRGRNYAGASSNKSKITCCPSCRKPLPRCALCLIHMGTPSATVIAPTPEEKIVIDETKMQKLSLFVGWFTWCQSCRHGGHANHIAAWFKEHSECPVTACNCRCMALDAVNWSESSCK